MFSLKLSSQKACLAVKARLHAFIKVCFLCLLACSVQSSPVDKLDEDMTLFQFSQVVAEVFDYAIVFSPRVRKNREVGMVISDSLEPSQLYNIFLSVLDLQGYTAVKTDNLVRVVREYKSRSMPSGL